MEVERDEEACIEEWVYSYSVKTETLVLVSAVGIISNLPNYCSI